MACERCAELEHDVSQAAAWLRLCRQQIGELGRENTALREGHEAAVEVVTKSFERELAEAREVIARLTAEILGQGGIECARQGRRAGLREALKALEATCNTGVGLGAEVRCAIESLKETP